MFFYHVSGVVKGVFDSGRMEKEAFGIFKLTKKSTSGDKKTDISNSIVSFMTKAETP